MSEDHEIVLTGGFMSDAFNRVNSNRNALHSKRKNSNPSQIDLGRNKAVINPEISKEELSQVIAKIETKLKLRRKQRLIVFSIFSGLIIIALFIIF